VARIIANVLSRVDVKEVLRAGPQVSIRSAALGLPEQFATQAIGFRALAGVGLINPYLSLVAEPAISKVKAAFKATILDPIFGKAKPLVMAKVTGTKAPEEVGKLDSPGKPQADAKFSVTRERPENLRMVSGTQANDQHAPKRGARFESGKFPGLRSTGGVLPAVSPSSASIEPVTSLNDDGTVRWEPIPVLDNTGTNIAHSGTSPATAVIRDRGGSGQFFNSPRQTHSMGYENVRRYEEDLILSHRFLVLDVTGQDGRSVFEWSENEIPASLAAGFETCEAPTFRIATEEIKEGTWEFPRVVPIGVEANTITMTKGMVKGKTGFYLWILNAMRGLLTRRTLEIVAYGRAQNPWAPWSAKSDLRPYGVASWKLFNCFPVSYRPGQQWDANTGTPQISELEVAYEWFEESVDGTAASTYGDNDESAYEIVATGEGTFVSPTEMAAAAQQMDRGAWVR